MVARRISHYRILQKLGAGGMGQVYLAEDTNLRRRVALKILSAELIKNENRLRRFEQEAFAASALSHPNILVIHEIGIEGDTHFIATEFIEGETLRQRIHHKKFQLREALEVAIQAASALSAAHKAGIVHRDVKPENIMVREDGYAKVLDFGLAKLTEGHARSTDTEAQTIPKVDTDPGTVLGTVNYMSPEQARGNPIDPRTDVFSLGAVIYEMVAGRPAFEGESSTDVLAAILDKDPPPLARFAPETPAELQRIVSKSLCKDREERYQTSKDLLIDLRNLKEQLAFEEKLERSVSPESDGLQPVATGSAESRTTSNASAGQSIDAITAPTTSSVEIILSEIKRHKVGAAAGLVALLLLATGAGYVGYRLLNKGSEPQPFQSFKITRLTNTGKASDAVISPDGRYVVHVIDDAAKQSLWIRHVNTASNVQIVPPADVNYLGMTFSRDGDYVYYVTRERNSPEGDLFQIAVLGGTPRKLIEDIDTPVGFSPDQKRLAFIRNVGSTESHLMVANADGSAEQKLATLKRPDFFLFNQARGPAWSPDGKVIACGMEQRDASGSYQTLALVGTDGVLKRLAAVRLYFIRRTAWLADGTGLLMVAADTPATFASQQVYCVSYPEGTVRQVTNDLNNYYGMSLRSDSSAFVTVQQVTIANIWVAPAADATAARQLTSGGSKYDGVDGVTIAPDGRIVYFSTAAGNPDLWIMEADGSGQRQLAADGRFPVVSGDGRYVAFISWRTGSNLVWRLDLGGSTFKQLSNQVVRDRPDFSSDGRWVIYSPLDNYGVFKVSIDGGESVQLSTEGLRIYHPRVSPDGKLIACLYRGSDLVRYQLAILPFEGGQPLKVLDLSRTAEYFKDQCWSPDGRAIQYIDTRGGVSNIWTQPVDGSPAKQLTNFKSDLIFRFDWSRDGKQLVLSRGTINSDVVLISENK